MAGHETPSVARGRGRARRLGRRDHARSPRGRPLDRQAREERDALGPRDRRRPTPAAPGDRAVAEEPDPLPHLLRARPRPHPARSVLPPARRQDPGVRLPRRPPAHPADPCPRGRPGGPSVARGAAAQRGPDRGDRARARLRTRAGRPRQRGRPVALRRRRATTTPCGAPTSPCSRSTCAPRRSTASATTRGVGRRRTRRRARSCRWADRIAYVCHDFEDAVAAGIVAPEMLPAVVLSACGDRRSRRSSARSSGR